MTRATAMSPLASLLRKPLRSQPAGVKAAVRQLLTELRLARAARGSRKAFAALRGRTGLKVHLGCGPDIRPGWVNVDLILGPAPRIDPAAQPDTFLIVHDLRDGLPMDEGSCDIIYSSHFFEHLSLAHGMKLMKDCYRALRPGGTFRIVLPDFRKSFDAYLRRDADFFSTFDDHDLLSRFDSESRTFVDYVNYLVYQYGEHVAIYDEEKITHVLKGLGFRGVEASEHRPGMDPDNVLRRKYSFYTEATK